MRINITKSAFITWLKTKSGFYDYTSIFNCPVCQFVNDKLGMTAAPSGFADFEARQDLDYVTVCPNHIYLRKGGKEKIIGNVPGWLTKILYVDDNLLGRAARRKIWTFEKLLERVEAT